MTSGVGAVIDLIKRLWSVTPPEVQRTVGEKEAIARILIGPGVTLIGPIGAAYMVYRGLLKYPFTFPSWVAICVGIAIEITAFHIGGEMLETIDANRRLTKKKEQQTQAGRSWLTIVLFAGFVLGEIVFIGYMDTWWAFFLPLLSVVNTLTTNERISRFWREQETQLPRIEVLPPQRPTASRPMLGGASADLAPGLLPQASSYIADEKPPDPSPRSQEHYRAVSALVSVRQRYPHASLAELGRLTAKALGRPKPFVKSWVSDALKEAGIS